jgi:DNA-binding PadR family transcriptional regulator
MDIISDIEAAILGLICESPQYGYQLEKIVEERGMRNWTEIGFSSIYYVLKRLEKKNYIMGEMKAIEGKPARKVYTITSQGIDAMQLKVKSALSENQKSIYPIDIGIANIPIISPEESLKSLKSYIESMNEKINFLEKSVKLHKDLKSPYFVVALFDRPLNQLKCEKEWINKFIKIIKEEQKIRG